MERHRSFTRRSFLGGAMGALAGMSTACADRQISSDGTSGASDATSSLEFFDMHADTVDVLGMTSHTPYATFHDKFYGSLVSNNGQVSVDRMGDARWVQCYSVWIPDAEGDDQGDVPAIDWYREAVSWFKGQMEECGDRIEQARAFSDVAGILDAGKVAAILTVENAACLDAGIEVVDEFAQDGVLIAGLTWNYTNAVGSGNNYPDKGLSKLGKRYLRALEEHDIVADVSHLNEKGFWELEKLATKPYVATHSNARAVCDHLRNLTDEQFSAITARGGVVGLNLNDAFVHEGGYAYTFDELAAHVEHWLDLGGEDFIAFGSDRDGAAIPTWIADCSNQAYLFGLFSERFGEDITQKLFFQNAMRFFEGVS